MALRNHEVNEERLCLVQEVLFRDGLATAESTINAMSCCRLPELLRVKNGRRG